MVASSQTPPLQNAPLGTFSLQKKAKAAGPTDRALGGVVNCVHSRTPPNPLQRPWPSFVGGGVTASGPGVRFMPREEQENPAYRRRKSVKAIVLACPQQMISTTSHHLESARFSGLVRALPLLLRVPPGRYDHAE